MVYNCPVYSYCTHAYRLHFKHKWDISDTSYSSKLALLISANHLHSEHDSNRGALSSISRSCWLSMHLPYRGQMLGKRGGLAVRIFPEGWVLSQDCHMQTPISPCLQQGDMGGYVGGWYAGLCPGMGACFIRACQFPSYLLSSPRYWRWGIPLIGI